MKSNGGIRKRLAPTLMAAMLLPTQQQLEMICGLIGHPFCKTTKKREKKRNLLLQVGPIKTIFQTCLNRCHFNHANKYWGEGQTGKK